MKKLVLGLILILNGIVSFAQSKVLYSYTQTGGNNNEGLIFEYDYNSNSVSVKYHFANDGSGRRPRADLMQASNGKLYGTTYLGGINDLGTLFEFDLNTNTYSKLFDFDSINGFYPITTLTEVGNGKLYGSTTKGGLSNMGVIFEYDINNSTYNIMQELNSAKGYNIGGEDEMILGSDGLLYGTKRFGGINNKGLIFKYNPSINDYEIIFDFDTIPNSYNPYGALIEFSQDVFFGLARNNANSGAIYSFNLNTGDCKVQYGFGGAADGTSFNSRISDFNNKIFGLTKQGGQYGDGTLIEFIPNPGGSINYKVEFDCTNSGINGCAPWGGVTLASNNNFYGLTSGGGFNGGGNGVVFEYNPQSSTYQKKININGTGVSNPLGNFIEVTLCDPTSSNHIVNECNSYTWIDGNTYNSSNNTATHILTNANGCDSTVTLNLTINNSNSGIDTRTECDSLVWIDGNTYYSDNNTATHVLLNSEGCDSIVSLNLIIKNSSQDPTFDTIRACQQYTWSWGDGNTYYTDTLISAPSITYQNSVGCDSIFTRYIDIGQPTDEHFYTESCEPVYIAGIYVDSTQVVSIPGTLNEWGCYHSWVYHVTINESPEVSISPFFKNPMCLKDNMVPLPPATPSGGSYVGAGIDGNNYNPDWAGLGNQYIYYELEGANGCFGRDTAFVTIIESPDYDYQTSGNTVTLSSNTPCSNFYWDFGDGSTNSLTLNPAHTFTADGTYTICMVCNDITNCANCVNLPFPSQLSGRVNGIVNIDEVIEEKQFSIYPNPNNGNFNVLYNDDLVGKRIQIINLTGQVVYSELFSGNSNSTQIDISSLLDGIYIVAIETDKGKIVKKIIKE